MVEIGTTCSDKLFKSIILKNPVNTVVVIKMKIQTITVAVYVCAVVLGHCDPHTDNARVAPIRVTKHNSLLV